MSGRDAEFVPRDAATCGRELARDAEVPDLLAQLMDHVATNMDQHATWVHGSGDAGADEARGLRDVAERYRAIAREAEKAAATMRSLRDLPVAPHDPHLLDRAALVQWMKTKVVLQRRLAAMLSEHATASEAVLKKMEP